MSDAARLYCTRPEFFTGSGVNLKGGCDEQAWDQHWDWFQQLPASSHMFSSNATESYRAEGSFPWDKGHALSAI